MSNITHGLTNALEEVGNAIGAEAERHQVRAWTRETVFHACKFANEEDLDVNSTISKACRRRMGYSEATWATKWTGDFRRVVKTALASKRNSMQQMVGLSVIASINDSIKEDGDASYIDWSCETLERIVDKKREDPVLYRWFYETVLKYEVGVTRWREKVMSGQCLATEVATEIDEAHGLILLVNHWKEWKRRAEEGTTPQRGQRGQRGGRQTSGSEVLTEYTCRDVGGQRVSWSEEGINRFNELVDEVVADRRQNEAFDGNLKEQLEQEAGNKRKKRKRDSPTDKVRAKNVLARVLGEGDHEGHVGRGEE